MSACLPSWAEEDVLKPVAFQSWLCIHHDFISKVILNKSKWRSCLCWLRSMVYLTKTGRTMLLSNVLHCCGSGVILDNIYFVDNFKWLIFKVSWSLIRITGKLSVAQQHCSNRCSSYLRWCNLGKVLCNVNRWLQNHRNGGHVLSMEICPNNNTHKHCPATQLQRTQCVINFTGFASII